MWKNIKNTEFYLTYADSYDIFITDYLNIWFLYLPRTKFLQCLKQSNTILNMHEDVMLEKALNILSNPNDIKNAEVKLENPSLSLIMTKMFGYPFKINIKLVEGSRELFFQKITQPILRTVKDLKDGQLELCDLLVKKDREISHLKSGDTDTPFHKKTKEFKEQSFLNSHTKYKDYFGVESIPSSVLEKVITPKDVINLKQEGDISSNDTKTNIKMEPESQVSDRLRTSDHNGTISIKQEPEQTIKAEPVTTSQSPRKRSRKLNI